MSAAVVNLAERREEKATETILRNLFRSGIDGILPLGGLIEFCRNPQYQIDCDEARNLQRLGLLEVDGTVSSLVRKIVLSSTFGGVFFGL